MENEKKNICINIFSKFSNSMCEKKMYICIFGHFPIAEKKKKKKMKKKKWCITVLGYCPNCSVT